MENEDNGKDPSWYATFMKRPPFPSSAPLSPKSLFVAHSRFFDVPIFIIFLFYVSGKTGGIAGVKRKSSKAEQPSFILKRSRKSNTTTFTQIRSKSEEINMLWIN
jgi:hypothetical protein